jgi:hypothetical protein
MAPDALADRLAALERSQRRLRAAITVLALGLATAVLLGAADDGVLSGRTLKLLDEQGRVRVLLTTRTGLSLLDETGRPRASLGLETDGAPALLLNGDASRVILGVNGDGPALALTGARGVLRAVFALVRDQPGLVFFDAQERERARIAVEADSGRGVLRAAGGEATWQVPSHQ